VVGVAWIQIIVREVIVPLAFESGAPLGQFDVHSAPSDFRFGFCIHCLLRTLALFVLDECIAFHFVGHEVLYNFDFLYLALAFEDFSQVVVGEDVVTIQIIDLDAIKRLRLLLLVTLFFALGDGVAERGGGLSIRFVLVQDIFVLVSLLGVSDFGFFILFILFILFIVFGFCICSGFWFICSGFIGRFGV